MQRIKKNFEQFAITVHLLKWTIMVIPLSFIIGSLVASFLWLLDEVNSLRLTYDWLFYFLPLAGIGIYFLYYKIGKNSEAGNNLILEEIQEFRGEIPIRMTPLVILTTLITHLFGGSAGREGTAVQIGGSIANLLGKRFSLNNEDIKTILMAGIAAGFGAVFGTPITGAIFALEVIAIGRIKYNALFPCLVASIFADMVCASWGIHHTHYQIDYKQVIGMTSSFIHIDFILLIKVIGAGVIFGLTSYVFSELSHFIKNYSYKLIPIKWLIPFIGGILIIGLTFLLGKNDYLGLGVSNPDSKVVTIVSSFNLGGADTFSWFWKLLFTAITLGMGFKGGEVTPLFFIGATMGNTIAFITESPIDLLAGLGFIAVFAGATNTPIACTILGVELFGGEYILYYAIACFTAYYFSGHTSIYQAQRIAVSKINPAENTNEITLREIREKRLKTFQNERKDKETYIR